MKTGYWFALFLISTSAWAATGVSNESSALNPAMSVDALFSLTQFSQREPITFDGGHDPHQHGFNLQQVELTYGANVDPYFRADAALVLTPEGIEIEEAYGTTLGLPGNLQFKVGQFFTSFGRHNVSHPHGWDFADKPLVLGRMFGGDGLRNPGAQLSWLTPLPWYSELIVSGQNSNGETAVSFGGDTRAMRAIGDALALARWANFVSLGNSLSVNLGASYLGGPNPNGRTRIFGGDIYVKYRNPSSLSFVALTVEALKRSYLDSSVDATDWGWYAQLTYRLPEGMERWHLGVRYDWTSDKNGIPAVTSSRDDGSGGTIDLDQTQRKRISPMITYYPSEFSKVRLQYNYDKPVDLEQAQHVFTAQFEFLIGSHGAHKF